MKKKLGILLLASIMMLCALPVSGKSSADFSTLTEKTTVTDKVIETVTEGPGYPTLDTTPGTGFTDGQDAELVLSSYGFDKSSGATTFNHPNGIATDGEHFFVCDTWNHRVLVYNSLPDGNSVPDLVLGQEDFDSAKAGYGLDEMNWPVGVATDGTRLFVTDTRNHRVLVWNSLPTENGQPADWTLNMFDDTNPTAIILWPWAVWTNGKKLIVTATTSGELLIWNTMPDSTDDMPDIVIQTGGTPRTIISDGESYLIVGDHNIEDDGRIEAGNRVWTSFPTGSDDKEDFCSFEGWQMGGCELPDGRIVLMSNRLLIYDSKPTSSDWKPSLIVGGGTSDPDDDDLYYYFNGGDFNQCIYAGGRLYAACYNGSKIVAYEEIPDSPHDLPAIVIGAEDKNEDPLMKNGIFQNLIPDTDGKRLVAIDDFNGYMYLWKDLPGESCALPDYTYKFYQFAPTDCCLNDGKLAVIGYGADVSKIAIWNSVPCGNIAPDYYFTRRIGNIELSTDPNNGIAIDENYLYISDRAAHKTYVFDGIPEDGEAPLYTLNHSGFLNVTGGHLAIADGSAWIYDLNRLDEGEEAVVNISQAILSYIEHGEIKKDFRPLNTVGEVMVGPKGELIITEYNWSQVLYWDSVAEAVAGKQPVILGFSDRNYTNYTVGSGTYDKDMIITTSKSSGYSLKGLAYDGQHLWVSEMKFSSRMLLFNKNVTGSAISTQITVDAGTLLENISLTPFDSDAGTFAWKDGSLAVLAKEHAYTAIFTPSDGAHTMEVPIVITGIGHYECGDVNEDGRADALDALDILKQVAGMEVAVFNESVSDTNGDNRSDALDALNILKKVAGMLDTLPVS